MPRGNEPLGEIATDVLFENERVKIWMLVVESGEASPWHQHMRDYITVAVEGVEPHTAEFEDGTGKKNGSTPGTCFYHGDGQPGPSGHYIHRVVNETPHCYRNILVELKD